MPELMSALPVRTLREAPADAGTPGYAMLLRAGYLRRVPGGHEWSVLGRRLLDNAARVVAAEVGPARPGGDGVVEARRPPAGSGLLRDPDGLLAQAPGDGHREAYERALDRLGVDWRLDDDGVFRAAVAGAAEPVATSPDCGWTAGTDAVPSPTASAPFVQPPPIELLDTPGTPTIATLAAALGLPPAATLKNLLVLAGTEVVAVGVPGDREVDLDRVAAVLGPVRLFTDADFAAHPGLVRGYVGPQGLGLRYLADRRVGLGTGWVTGANAEGRHARNVVAGRDFAVSAYGDLVVVRDGDPCPRCGQPLRLGTAVAVARLGPVSSVDLTRVVAVAAEQHSDERGLAWPRELSPYDVQLVPVGRGDQPGFARDLGDRLTATGLRVLIDDRDASAGVKLTDAELLGVPHVVVVGRRAAEGVVEVRTRATGATTEVTMDDMIWAVIGQ
ncbi:MAG TPA: YbaK/EbsC family protein [Mycobacteriales bacterium]|nr:YbaK/EbsC family protein [Mycobacteriales bacterium]